MTRLKKSNKACLTVALLAVLALAMGLMDDAAAEDEIVQLTDGPHSVLDYNWAPNSGAIAFNELTDNGLAQLSYVPLPAGPPELLASDVDDWSSPSWSEDSQYLLTSFLEDDRRLLARIEVSTGNRATVGSDEASLYSPSFGPTGGNFEDVLVSFSTGGDLRGIARLDMVNLLVETWADPGPGNISPSWPGFGRPGPVFSSPGTNGFMQLHQIDFPLGPEIPLTDCECDVCGDDVDPVTGAAAYTAGFSDDDAESGQLFVQEGIGPPVQITSELVHHSSPRWASPNFGPGDGGYLLYDRLDAEDNYNIFMVHKTGGDETQLTFGPVPKRLAKSSPDGSMLAYVQFDAIEREESGVWHLYLMPAPTSVPWTPGSAGSLLLSARSVHSGGGDLEFRFEIPESMSGNAELAIFDVSGRKVATIHRGRSGAASQTATWDGRNASGQAMPSGVFFAHLQVGKERATQKFTRLR